MTEPTRFVDGLLSQVQDIAISQVRRLAPSFSRGVVTGVEPLSVRLDGQEGSLASAPESLVGGLAVGDVVYVVVYARRAVVLGRRGGPRVPSVHLAQATSRIMVSTTAQTVPGASITLALNAGDVVQVLGVFDQDASSGIFLGRLLIDGVPQAGEAHSQSGARTTVSQVWQWTASSSGSHTVALSAATVSGSANVYETHTCLSIIVIPAP